MLSFALCGRQFFKRQKQFQDEKICIYIYLISTRTSPTTNKKHLYLLSFIVACATMLLLLLLPLHQSVMLWQEKIFENMKMMMMMMIIKEGRGREMPIRLEIITSLEKHASEHIYVILHSSSFYLSFFLVLLLLHVFCLLLHSLSNWTHAETSAHTKTEHSEHSSQLSPLNISSANDCNNNNNNKKKETAKKSRTRNVLFLSL